MSPDANSLVLKQPLWKRAALLVISAAFVVGGVYIILAGDYLIGLLCIVFFGGGGVLVLFKSRLVLIADTEGIVPVFVLPRGTMTKIPWSMIDKIYVATAKMGSNTQRYLAMTLHDPDFLTRNSTARKIGATMNQLVGSKMIDDGGVAQVYIPTVELPGWSVENIVEQLHSLRPVESRI